MGKSGITDTRFDDDVEIPSDPTHYTYSRYLKETFGAKTYKIVVSSGLSCPTRDGLLDQGGCAFCDVRGSSSFYGKVGRGASIREQIQTRIPGIRERFGAEKFIAYFQSYTNTYSDIDYLREIYEAALAEPGISGLAIGTRPDCIPDTVIDLLEELAKKHYVCLELGVQSFEDEALLWLERGHDGQSSIDALERLRTRAPHVQTCVHLMFGSVPDSAHAPRDAALILNRLGVRGVKLHQLMILERTKLATLYRESPFRILTLEEYASQVIEFLEHLAPEIYVERLTAQATHRDECIAPVWSRHRWNTHNEIRAALEAKPCRQGSRAHHALDLPNGLSFAREGSSQQLSPLLKS